MPPTQAVANPTAEVSEGFDVFYRAPEPTLNSEQADYLLILQDKFGTPGPSRGHWYLNTDDASARNGEDGNYLENFADTDNDSYNDRRSLKSASHSLLSI
jgi:hypothetical protein